jgi:hypothetical protein
MIVTFDNTNGHSILIASVLNTNLILMGHKANLVPVNNLTEEDEVGYSCLTDVREGVLLININEVAVTLPELDLATLVNDVLCNKSLTELDPVRYREMVKEAQECINTKSMFLPQFEPLTESSIEEYYLVANVVKEQITKNMRISHTGLYHILEIDTSLWDMAERVLNFSKVKCVLTSTINNATKYHRCVNINDGIIDDVNKTMALNLSFPSNSRIVLE